jgi:glycogen debranching enzyme
VVSGDPPYTPGGCPFQAWSLAALLRLERIAGTIS